MKKGTTTKLKAIKSHADSKACPVEKCLDLVTAFLDGPMCGRCFPCALGCYEVKVRLERVAEGSGRNADVVAIRRIADNLLISALCNKGKKIAGYLLEWLDADLKAHIAGRCPHNVCKGFLEYRVIPSKCIVCGLCKEACQDRAILGTRRKHNYEAGSPPFEIRQKRCTKCGLCKDACPTGAIVIVTSAPAKSGRPLT